MEKIKAKNEIFGKDVKIIKLLTSSSLSFGEGLG
jgi:hypothetical protein